MKKKWISTLLLLGYCVPYAYFALWGDAKIGTTLLYGVLLAAHAVLCTLALKTHHAWAAIVGSALSGAVSLLFVRPSPLMEMNHYFKPFTAMQLTAAVSLIMFVIQAGAAVLWKKKGK